jgi:NitT/TauT family transport system ATP-binding protein
MAAQMATADAILVADSIAVRFETAEGPVIAVDDVSFQVRPGEFLSVIGPSGCGKSTLFNVIGGLLSNHQGVVSVAGEIINGPHKSIGMVFQEESTFPWRTVTDNVAFPLELIGMPRDKRIERARHFIALVGLDGFENRYPGELSGGMRQRVSLARTLASEPKILLMDEPFAALDEQTKLILQDDLLRIWEGTRKTVVFITHSLDEAITLGDRVVVMSRRPGRIKATFDIPLQRPRDAMDLRNDMRFVRIRQQVWDALREEVVSLHGDPDGENA